MSLASITLTPMTPRLVKLAEGSDRLSTRELLITAMGIELDLNYARSLITRARNSSGRVELSLYEDMQTFLHSMDAKDK